MMNRSDVSIADALAGKPGENQTVTVKGWVRTRRDSKGGFSFLAVNDGSCFDPIQVVAPDTLPNYQSEVMQLTAGCSVDRHRHARAVAGQGAGVRDPGDARSKVVGWVDDPDTYPIQPKQHTFEYLREVAHLRPRTNTFGAVTRVRHTLAWRCTASSTSTASSGSTRRSSPPSTPRAPAQMFRVSTLDLANLPRTPEGQDRLRAGLLRQAGVPDRLRPAQRRDLLPGDEQGLHVRPDLPRREQSTRRGTWPSSG